MIAAMRTGTRQRRVLAVAAMSLGLVATAQESVWAQAILPIGFVDEAVVGGLNQPTAFTRLPDGRLLIAEKAGLVRVFKNGAPLATPFIDLRNSVNDYWDRGLIGIAADRNFANSGFVYLLFTYENDPADYSGPKTARLIRVTASGDVASPNTATTILGTSVGRSCKDFPAGADCLPSDGPSHSVGNVKVAADGTLWVTLGDSANFNLVDDDALRAQDVDSLSGKLLHVTPTGAGLPSNPFWNGNANANRSKVWAYGMRNPYRFALHPTSGMPYLGDVGWSEWEEINAPVATTSSMNLGWPCYEGPLRQSGYSIKPTCQSLYLTEPTGTLPPLIAYSHNTGGSSAVTGGAFYTGTTFPSQYRGAYFYADYAIGFVRYFRVASDGTMSGPVTGFGANLGGPVYIDTDGESLLYVAIYTGEVRRIRYITPGSSLSYLSDRSWTSMSNGTGPVERDQSNGDAGLADGRVIQLGGQAHAKGLGASAPSDVRFPLSASCSDFNASVGLDDETGGNGTATFEVWLDGVKSYDSGTMNGATPARAISLNVTGRNELRLVVTDAGDGAADDHADWADARLTCTVPPDGGAPAVIEVTPPAGATGVGVSTVVVGTFSEAMSPTTITTSTVTLAPQGKTTVVSASVAYDEATARATLTPASALEGTTTYTATIKGGPNGVKDLAGNALPSDRVWSFTTAVAPVPSYLSDRAWTSATNGYGPVERDRSNGEDLAGDGTTITLNGVAYPKGLGVHATAEVRYPLNAACTAFTAVVGVDDEVGANGSVSFQVWTDGVQRYDSGVMTGAMAGRSVAVDVTGANELLLFMTDGGDGSDYDHGDWADAKVTCSGTGAPPAATINQPLSTLRYKVGDVIIYSGSATDPEDGVLPASSLTWNVTLYHCPGGICHIHPFTSSTGASGSFTVPDHGDDNYFLISLTATDSAGNSSTSSVTIQPQTVQLTLNTSPTGLQVVYGGVAAVAPVTFTTVVGTTHTILAPSPQGSQTFVSWSDGGAQQHNIVVGATDAAYTAFFSGDTTPPTVTSVTPANGAANVSVGTTVGAVFSESMSPPTLTTATVTLVVQGSTTPLAASVTYNASTMAVTLVPSTNLAAGTTYTARVKGGSSGARDLAGNALASDVVWSFTTTGATSPYLSDRAWTSATNGYGPVERDRSNGEDLAGDGATITLNGVTYAKGLGVHATAEVRYPLNAACTAFTAVVGVDDEVGANGSVSFQVWTDGVQRYDSGVMTGAMAGRNVAVDVTGANELLLFMTDGGNGSDYDHGDWADARVTCAGGPVVSYLSDRAWTSATNGYGPVERDRSNGEDLAGDGTTITLNGVAYPKGLGVHATAEVRYPLNAACTAFTAVVGVDDEVGANGSVSFQVWTDGVQRYDSGVMTGAMAGRSVAVDVTGANELLLFMTDGGNGSDYDHGDWADAQVTCDTGGAMGTARIPLAVSTTGSVMTTR